MTHEYLSRRQTGELIEAGDKLRKRIYSKIDEERKRRDLIEEKKQSDIINWVILQGGDTDTNGAIAGALLGTYYGEARMKEDPTTNNNIQILLAADYSQGQLPINNNYHPATFLQMIQ